MRKAYQGLSKEIEHLDPVIDTRLDGSHVPGAGNGGDVDVTVVQHHLDVIRATQDEHVLLVLVGQHRELEGLPGVIHLQTHGTA